MHDIYHRANKQEEQVAIVVVATATTTTSRRGKERVQYTIRTCTLHNTTVV